MFVPWAALNCRHPLSDICAWGYKSKRRCLAEEETQAGAATSLRAHDWPLETVLSFKYLGRLLTAPDDDWSAVITNLWKAQNSWY